MGLIKQRCNCYVHDVVCYGLHRPVCCRAVRFLNGMLGVAVFCIAFLNAGFVASALEVIDINFLRSSAPNVLNEWDGDGMFVNAINYSAAYDLNSPLSSIPDSENAAGSILASKPYFYPNPFRLSRGSILGFRLTQPAIFEIRIYDMRAYELFRESYDSALNGGHENIQISFDRSSFGADLSAGIYFFLIIHENKVIGRGKFALRPE